MSSKKNKLPDSLELLLDTMCNTFGGIMFIAIALIIITQVSRQVVIDKTMPDISPEHINEMKRAIAELEAKCSELELDNMNKALEASKLTPKVKEDIIAILKAREENERLEQELEDQESIIENYQQMIADVQAKIDDLMIKKTEIEEEAKEKLTEEKIKRANLENAIKDIEDRLKKLQARVASLRKELDDVKPAQTITFSMEEKTARRQIDVYLYRGELYTDDTVNQNHNALLHTVKVIPLAGKGVKCTEANLSKVFNSYSKNNNLIVLWADHDSFFTLLATRQFLRSHKFIASWFIVENFIFSTEGGVGAGSY